MIKKCLFPAAGYGTRFLPATKAMPKEMLPIVNKPLIQYGVEEAKNAGMSEIAIVTGRGKQAIENHFDISYELEHQLRGTSKEQYLTDIRLLIENLTFSYTRQNEMKGLGHAVLKGRTLIGNEPFAVILADDLCYNDGGDGVLEQMRKMYEKHECCIVAVEKVPKDQVHKYGIINGVRLEDRLLRIEGMVEKPSVEDAPSNYAVIGRYIITPDIFEVLERTQPGKGGEIQLTDALVQLAKKGKVIAYEFEGNRFDCGMPSGYKQAFDYFYEKEFE